MILKKLKALLGAESTLQARTKMVKVLQAEESRLRELILDRVTTERLRVEAETSVVLGEQAEASAAQRKFDEAVGAINRQSVKLSGLRSRIASQATELEAQRISVKAALPAHVASIKNSFLAEWTEGVAAFGALLGKRSALEVMVGPLSLPELRPNTYDLPADIAAPWNTLDEIGTALDEVAGWSVAATWPAVDRMRGVSSYGFDPNAVYVATDGSSGLEKGTPCMECSFTPGTLRHLVSIGYAVPLSSVDWESVLESGRMAARRVSAERQQEQQQADHERNAPRVVKYDPIEAAKAAAENLRIIEAPGTGALGKEWSGGSERRVTGNM